MDPCDDIWKDCERLGEDAVRAKFAAKAWSVPASAGCVEHWLSQKDAERTAAADAKRDAREAEALSIAKEANRLASEANSIAHLEAAAAARSSRYAMYAAIIATVAAIISIKDQIVALISGQP